MKLEFKNFEDARVEYANVVENGTQEEQKVAFNNMMSTLAKDVENKVLAECQRQSADNIILSNRGQKVLTSEELKFFNSVVEDGGFKKDTILPKTTQERIFEDLVENHPLLAKLGLQDYGAITEIILSNSTGAAIWSPIFGEIQGKLNADFRKEKIEQYKLTSYIALSNDMLTLGPVWVEQYVRTILVEALQVALEKGFVAGNGKNEPIGLNRDLAAAVTNGEYAEKKPVGKLTFANSKAMISELGSVMKKLAEYKRKKADGTEEETVSHRNISGKVVMLVNPFDNYDITAKATTQTLNGTFITNLPFNPTLIESVFVPQGKVIFFVEGRYLAIMGGQYKLAKFEQTLAVEDATLFTAKQYSNGRPLDNYTSLVYTLEIPPTV